MSIKEIIGSTIGFFVVITLLVYGLRYGLKKIQKNKYSKPIEYLAELNIHFTSQISYKDYKSLMLELSFKKPVYFVLIGIIILLALSLLANDHITSNSYIIITVLIFGVIFIPIATIRQIKRMYQTNQIFHEQLKYSLDNNSIHIKGNTIDSTVLWTRFYKIKETKRFFMLYSGENIATLLEKKMFPEKAINEFREFIKSLSLIKELQV
jgi:hypothetical protein